MQSLRILEVVGGPFDGLDVGVPAEAAGAVLGNAPYIVRGATLVYAPEARIDTCCEGDDDPRPAGRAA